MKKFAAYSFSKNGDMETHAKFICESKFDDLQFIRKNKIFQGVRETDGTLLMSHSLKSFPLLATCLILRKPLYCQIHDETPHPGLKYPIIYLLNWLLVRSSKITIYFSPPERFARFPHGLANLPSVVDENVTPTRPPEVPSNWSGYLMFGRCESYKYTHEFMHAVRQNIENIVFAGRGWGTIVKSTDKINVIDRYISNEELAWLIKKAKGTVLPYSSATQSGIAPIIAALGGKAIVKDDMKKLISQLNEYGPYQTTEDWLKLFKMKKTNHMNTKKIFQKFQPDQYAKRIYTIILAEEKKHQKI